MPTDNYSTLKFEVDSRGVARVTLNRPQVHNAFNEQLIDELHRVFLGIHSDPTVRVVVLAGEGKNFSAGADIDWMHRQAQATYEDNLASARQMAAMFQMIDRCNKPTVAAIQGAALGGGSGLAAVVDIVIAQTSAKFGFTEVKLGILPAVISPFVMRKIGYSQARARFLTGARFGAQEAFQIGLAHYVVDDLVAQLELVLGELLSAAPQAQQRCKRLIDAIYPIHPFDVTELTTQNIAQARASDEGREGLGAFLEKRSPNWSQG
jgi:methylglutaconyl-CoA hydratase